MHVCECVSLSGHLLISSKTTSMNIVCESVYVHIFLHIVLVCVFQM